MSMALLPNASPCAMLILSMPGTKGSHQANKEDDENGEHRRVRSPAPVRPRWARYERRNRRCTSGRTSTSCRRERGSGAGSVFPWLATCQLTGAGGTEDGCCLRTGAYQGSAVGVEA